MDAQAILAQYGLPGLIIAVESGVILVIWKLYQTVLDRLFDLQEARRLEALDREAKLTATMNTFSQSSQLLVDKIVDVQTKGRKR